MNDVVRGSFTMMRISTIPTICVVAFLITVGAQAQDAPLERGHALAQANCARCHAIGRSGDSPLAKAPTFRTLHRRYPVDALAEALAEGIKVAHPMPQFRLEPGQIDDLIAYIRSLEG